MRIKRFVHTDAIAVAAIFALAAARAASADPILAMSLPASQTSTASSGLTFGEDFTVISPISVTDLATFDAYDTAIGENAPLGTTYNSQAYPSISVEVFYTTGVNAGTIVPGLNASATGTGAININDATLVGSTSMLALDSFTPVTLEPGTYRIAATGYLNTYAAAYNSQGSATAVVSDTGGGLISFPADNGVGAGYNNYYGSSAVGTYPNSADNLPINRYGDGSFEFVAAPEPASLSLLAIGSLGLLARRRARR